MNPRFIIWLSLILSPAMAIAANAPPGASKFASKGAPIEITSDQLEVFQDENRAVFTGNVVAIQGQIRLKSDKMVVHYRKQEEQKGKNGKPVPKAEKSPTLTPSQGAIEKIDVEGNVFVSTPEETASGTTGLYDVDAHEIHLDTDVVLTKGKNILKGDHLIYNMATGKSVLTQGGKPMLPWGQPERVRALFVPDTKPGAQQKPAGAVKPVTPPKPKDLNDSFNDDADTSGK